MEDITSPSREERDYEIILDNISRLSLKEDLLRDNPIIEYRHMYSLAASTITITIRHIVTS